MSIKSNLLYKEKTYAPVCAYSTCGCLRGICAGSYQRSSKFSDIAYTLGLVLLGLVIVGWIPATAVIIEGRQHATKLDEIRRDHVARYEWASRLVKGHVVDLGCGIGYGSAMLAPYCFSVLAVDQSLDALNFGKEHWNHSRIVWQQADLNELAFDEVDWAVCFEVVEHLDDPMKLLQSVKAKNLLVSVPNEDVMPFDPVRHSYHFRHYQKPAFADLLFKSGWLVKYWYGQQGKRSNVEPDVNGMTLLARCESK